MKLNSAFKVLVLLLFISCTRQYPRIAFEEKIIDLGKIKRDTIIDVFFKPKNIGKKELIIERVKSDCHCTIARDFQKVIKPNNEGQIKVSYNSSKGFGYFEQLIEVYSSAENSPSLLIIKGRVDFSNRGSD